MKALLFFALFGLSLASICLKGVGQYRIRSTPCGNAVGWLNDAETTEYRSGDSPVSCVLAGTSYTWIPITKMGGWVASAGISACGGCVKVASGPVNVRSSPCGGVASTYATGVQKNLATTTLNTCAVGGKQYAWVNTPEGWVAVDFLAACSGAPPPPPPASGGCHTNARPSRLGQAGIDLITRWEGVIPCWYKDPVGYPTICIGHLITHNEYHSGQCLTKQQCQDLLRTDIGSYENCVKNNIRAPINQNQFDALVSFVYNLGCGSLQGSLANTINAGNYAGACGIMKQYVHAGGRVLQGLVNRRNDECNLFNSCGGVNFAGQFRTCPAADDCSSCILNSENDATFVMYENQGKNTSCDATIWKNLAEDYCNNVNPWECYWKVNGLTGFDNGTSLCPICASRTRPVVAQPGDPKDVNCLAEGANNQCTGKDDCALQLEGSTCDPLTGNCVITTETTPFLRRCTTVTDSASHTQVLVALAIALVALLLL